MYLVKISIIKDDQRALATELKRHALEVAFGSILHDLVANKAGAGESNLVDVWVASNGL